MQEHGSNENGKMSYKKIEVVKGEEYRARTENIYEESLYFSNVYFRAKGCLNEILKNGAVSEKSESSEFSLKQSCCRSDEKAEKVSTRFSNILSFCADRGQGKTTAMISFAKALQEISSKKEDEQASKFWEGTQAREYRYEVIDSIDPTAMEQGDSIVMMVLSRMFFRFKEACNQRNDREDPYDPTSALCKRDALVNSFQKCYHDWRVLSTAKTRREFEMEDELEHIMDLGDSTNLRNSLHKLISEYLGFLFPEKHGILVLQIDDADLNVDRVYNILEEIRKYLHLPNVVILLAANMRQMEATVEQYFLKEYKVSLRESGSMVDAERCHRIAEQYLEKLLPKPLRVYLPELNLGSEAIQEGEGGIRVYYQSVDSKKQGINLLDDAEGYSRGKESEWRYQKQLLHFLHRKTGLIYEAPREYLHNLLPATMRELTHFLAYFSELPDVPIGYQDIISYHAKGGLTVQDRENLKRWKANLAHLEHYLVYLWAPVNLRREGRTLFQEWTEQAQENRHRYLLHALPNYYAGERLAMDKDRGGDLQSAAKYRDSFLKECKERGVYIEDSLSREQKEGHVYASYADVVTALNVLTDMPGGGFQYKFCYALEFYYSISAHVLMLNNIQKYGEPTDEDGSPQKERPNKEKEESKQEPESKDSIPDFWGDILFRMGKQNDTGSHIAFWHLSFEGEKLLNLLSREKKGKKSIQDYGSLQETLREERKAVLCYATKPLNLFALSQTVAKEDEDGTPELKATVSRDEIDLSKLEGLTCIFNPFYFLWNGFRTLFEQKSEFNRRPDRRTLSPSSLEKAMTLLLNWDIQKRLLHEFKQLSSDGWNSLSAEMESLFSSSQMRDCFLDAAEINHLAVEQKAELLVFPEVREYKENYWLLQAASLEGKRRLTRRAGEIMNQLKAEAEKWAARNEKESKNEPVSPEEHESVARIMGSTLEIEGINESLWFLVPEEDMNQFTALGKEISDLCTKIAKPSKKADAAAEDTKQTEAVFNISFKQIANNLSTAISNYLRILRRIELKIWAEEEKAQRQ